MEGTPEGLPEKKRQLEPSEEPQWKEAIERGKKLCSRQNVPLERCSKRQYQSENEEILVLYELRKKYLEASFAVEHQHFLEFLETVTDEGCDLNSNCHCDKCNGVRDIYVEITLILTELHDLEEYKKEGILDLQGLKEK